MRRGLVLALLLAAVASCTEENASTFCVYHSDCADTSRPYCISGICRTEQCKSDHDCRLDEACLEGICQLRSAGVPADVASSGQ